VSVNCIVLDGWHKGHLVTLPEPPHSLSLIRPEVITIDYCCDGEEHRRVPTNKHDYHLAFTSLDRKTALYTTDGSSIAFDRRDWIVNIRGVQWAEQPIYVGMHDPRSVTQPTAIKLIGGE